MLKLLKKIRFTLIQRNIDRKEKKGIESTTLKGNSEEKIFFILGSGRNGSTLMAKLLNKHSQIFLPPEQYALPYSIADWHVSPIKKWQIYSKKQLTRYRQNNNNWKLDEGDYVQIAKQIENLTANERGPREIFKKVFFQYAKKYAANKSAVGDHSPLSTLFYKYLAYEFREDYHVFLIRHPLDVVLSYSKMPENAASNPQDSVKKWNNSVAAYDYLKEKKAKIFLVRYEDLVQKPREIIGEVLCFLNIAKEDLFIKENSQLANDSLGVSSLRHHQNLFKPISSDSIGKWKVGLDPELICKIQADVKINAQRFGYSLEINHEPKN